MCFGVCWTRDAGRFSKTFIKSKTHLASPTCSCVVNDFGMPTLPFYSQSHLLFSCDGARLTVVSTHRCEQSPTLPEPQGTCVPQAEWEEALPFLSIPIHPSFPVLCSLPEFPCLFPGQDQRGGQLISQVELSSKTSLQVSKTCTGFLCWFLLVTIGHRTLSAP